MLKYSVATVLAVNAISIRKEDELTASPTEGAKTSYAAMFLKRGDCPATETFKDLDLARLEGDWYTYTSLNTYNLFYNAECLHSVCTFDKESGVLNSDFEMELEGRHAKVHELRTFFEGDMLISDMFDQKLAFHGAILDTDYDNYVIGYSCFDSMKYDFDGDLEPVHVFMIDVSTRDPNTSEEEIDRLMEIVFEKVPEVSGDEF